MKFSIIREELLKPLQIVMGAIEKRHSRPILSNVLLRLKTDCLTLIATDLEIELHSTVKLNSIISTGEVTVPARKLLEICRALPEAKLINFALQGNEFLLTCEKSRFKLFTLPGNDFPNIEDEYGDFEFSVSPLILYELFQNVSFSMALQDIRYYLNGILFIKTTKFLKTVATDGHRLAICTKSIYLDGEDVNIIIPRKGVMELLRLLNTEESSVIVHISKSHLCIIGSTYTFITKLIDGVYPDFQRVIPKNTDKQISVEKELIKQVLSRIAILTNEKFHAIKFILQDNKLVIEAHNTEQEEAYEEIEVLYNSNPLEIGFNVSYLLEAINALPNGMINLKFADSSTSIQLEANQNNGSLYIIKPLQI